MPLTRILDTNILSDLLKHPAGKASNRIAALPSEEIAAMGTSIIVAAELRYGAAKKGSALLKQRAEQLLKAIPVLPLAPEAGRFYGDLRKHLEDAGEIIGGNDLLIAAHALAIDAVLVTDNMREFQRVPGLKLENWLRP